MILFSAPGSTLSKKRGWLLTCPFDMDPSQTVQPTPHNVNITGVSTRARAIAGITTRSAGITGVSTRQRSITGVL